MRVISGTYRGMKLAEFKGEDIRPTSDRVKESLFNILISRIAGSTVCDLFCGSGSLGIECLSRGAEKVCFNDISADSLAVLKSNLARLKGGAYAVTNSDYERFLLTAREPFDIIFIDPPYRFEYGKRALEIIAERKLLNDGGVAVYERDRTFTGDINGLELCDERKYGKTWLSFFRPSNREIL